MTDAEKLVRSTKRVVNATSKGKLAALLAERSRWKRKQTIATNKLADVQERIDAFADMMAEKLFDAELK